MESIVHDPLAPTFVGTVVFTGVVSTCGYASQQVHLGGEFTAFQFGFKGRSARERPGTPPGTFFWRVP
jgi:hypothetical protein